MRIGCRAHDFGKLDLETLAATIAGAGFESAQLAPWKAIEGVAMDDSFDEGFARSVRSAFGGRKLSVAVLGCYINPIHPDDVERRRGVERFRGLLRTARHFAVAPGTPQIAAGGPLAFPVVATETGSRNADCSPHRGNNSDSAFKELVETLAAIAEAAEGADAIACVEGVVRHVASTPARLKAALDAVGSPRLMVLFDPVNFLDSSNWRDQARMFDEAEELLGDRILVAHAKDFRPSQGELEICPPGTGLLDYGRFMGLMRRVRPDADILIEDLAPEAMPGARSFLAEAFSRA